MAIQSDTNNRSLSGMYAELASLAAGTVQGVFNSTSKLGLKRQLRYYNKAADADMQRKIHLWQMENEYNAPSAQMSRYKDAGLNPNLIYGTGSASAGNATGFPSVGGQKFDTDNKLDFSPAISSFAQMSMLKSNLAVNKSVEDRNEAAAEKDRAFARNYDGFIRAQIDEINSRINRNDVLNSLNLSQEDHQRLVNDILSSTKDNQIALSQVKLESERAALNTALYNLQEIAPLVAAKYRIDISKTRKTIEVLQTQKNLNNAQASCAYALAELYAAKKVNQDIANQYAIDRRNYDFGVYPQNAYGYATSAGTDPSFDQRMDTYRREWLSRQSEADLKQAELQFRNKYGWMPMYESTSAGAHIGPVGFNYSSSESINNN